MLKGLFTGLVALAAMGFARGAEDGTVGVSTVFGIIKVESPHTSTLVSVPWAASSGAAEEKAINVADVVKTSNLTEGDRLLAYNAGRGAYDGWSLAKASDGTLGWEPVTTVTAEGMAVAAGEATATLVRGQAIWLVRQDCSKPFFLQGQYASAPASVAVAGGTAETPAYTLLGNALRGEVGVNELAWGDAPAEGDRLSIPGGAVARVLTWDAAKGVWYRMVPTVTGGVVKNVRKEDDRIGAGAGFWYVRASAGGFTFTWKKKGAQ